MTKKLEDKIAVGTGGTEGIGLATAKLFVIEGAYVFITGRRQRRLDEAVKAIGTNVSGVQGDVAQLADLDRLYETVSKVKGLRWRCFWRRMTPVSSLVLNCSLTAAEPRSKRKRRGAFFWDRPEGPGGGNPL